MDWPWRVSISRGALKLLRGPNGRGGGYWSAMRLSTTGPVTPPPSATPPYSLLRAMRQPYARAPHSRAAGTYTNRGSRASKQLVHRRRIHAGRAVPGKTRAAIDLRNSHVIGP